MIRTNTRPMTDEEKQLFLKSYKEVGKLTDDLEKAGCALVATLILGILTFKILGIKDTRNVEQATIIPLLLGGVAFFAYLRLRSRRQKANHPLLLDLNEEVIRVSTYCATAAIRVEELEDEGYHFYVRLEDNRIFFMSGQYLYDDVDDKRFPCTEFTVTKGTHVDWILSLSCLGKYLPPEKTLNPFTEKDWADGTYPGDQSIVDSSWDNLLAGKR